jgi:hypothetical protein
LIVQRSSRRDSSIETGTARRNPAASRRYSWGRTVWRRGRGRRTARFSSRPNRRSGSGCRPPCGLRPRPPSRRVASACRQLRHDCAHGRGECGSHLGNRAPSRNDLWDDFALASGLASTSRRCARIPAPAQKRRRGRSFRSRRVPVSELKAKDNHPETAPGAPRKVPVWCPSLACETQLQTDTWRPRRAPSERERQFALSCPRPRSPGVRAAPLVGRLVNVQEGNGTDAVRRRNEVKAAPRL